MVSFEVGGGENIHGACATRNFMYLLRGPYISINNKHKQKDNFWSMNSMTIGILGVEWHGIL